MRDLLSGTSALRVPDYQRPYSWTISEAAQLLDDLLLAMDEDAALEQQAAGYFLGTMLLMEGSVAQPPAAAGMNGQHPDAGIEERDIVDGQQRTVTLTILFCVIRDLLAERGGGVLPILETALWIDRGPARDPEPRLRLRGREATFLRQFVLQPGAAASMPPDDELSLGEARILKVRERLVESLLDLDAAELGRLARYLLESCHLAVITTSNIDRAHRIFSVMNSRGRPLARNDILKAQLLGGIPEAERAAYLPVWDDMEQRLGADFEGLFSQIQKISGPGRERVITGIGRLVGDTGGHRAFFDEALLPYARIYEAMRAPRPAASGPEAILDHNLRYLGWLGSEEWVPPMLLFWHQSGGDPDALADFSTRLDRFAYSLRLLGLGVEKRQTRFNAVLASVKRGDWREADQSPFEISKEETRNIQYNLRSLHARSQLTCKLVLLRLNDLVSGSPQRLDPSELTVEHVLPQKPGRVSAWRTWFPSADERETCTQSLGNLILVRRSQNDRARNMELSRKLEVYFSDGEEHTLAITRELAGIREWRAEQILDREKRLFALIHQLWGIEPARAEAGARAAADTSRPGTA